ncbi:MAG TPA: hypothetical protein VK819_02835 [Acidobacteriaceae bacterium]|jgi:hypothetical protein|nr:hypothetical protein [Acidobacteriaceae bacterium]
MEENDVEGCEGAQAGKGVDALFLWLDDGGFGDWRENIENVSRRAGPWDDLGPCAQRWFLLFAIADAALMDPA